MSASLSFQTSRNIFSFGRMGKERQHPAEKIRGLRKRLKDNDDKIIEEIYAGYKRLLFVRTGIETEENLLRARHAADEMGWRFEEKIADLTVMKKLFSGEWDREFIILNPQ